MSARSGIEWTGATWNPVTGCTKVSPGCDHCYAERITERFHGPGAFAQVTLHPERLGLPLRWRAPRRVFVNSMADLFHAAVPDEFIAAVFATMRAAPQHTFQILTKRPARMRAFVTRYLAGAHGAARAAALPAWIWLGVSAETQTWADLRVPVLLDIPAAVRFVSAEPLLGPVDLRSAAAPMGSQRGHGLSASFAHAGGCCGRLHGIGWVIAGGESGPSARPVNPAWPRHLRGQCTAAGVPFFFKQWGTWVHDPAAPTGSPLHRRAGKAFPDHKTLDGATWRQFPDTGRSTAA